MKKLLCFCGCLFLVSVICFFAMPSIVRNGFIQDYVEGYLGNEDFYDELIEDPDFPGDSISPFELKVRKALTQSRDSVIVLIVDDSISDKPHLIEIVNRLMLYKPSALGLDFIHKEGGLNSEYDSVFLNLLHIYPNIVLPYSIVRGGHNQIEYPFGVKDYHDIPHLGYTNFDTKGKEIRYLTTYETVEGVKRPAFWTQLWAVSHPKEPLRSKRNLINFKLLNIESLKPFAIFRVSDIEGFGIDKMIKGKIVIVGDGDPNDYQIIPVRYKNDYTMPGTLAVAVAMQTITYNESSSLFIERYRIPIALCVLFVLCFITSLLHYFPATRDAGNLIQFIVAIILYYLASWLIDLCGRHGDVDILFAVWYYFKVIVIYVLFVAAATNGLDLLYKKVIKK